MREWQRQSHVKWYWVRLFWNDTPGRTFQRVMMHEGLPRRRLRSTYGFIHTVRAPQEAPSWGALDDSDTHREPAL
jgi:hypothetical protein